MSSLLSLCPGFHPQQKTFRQLLIRRIVGEFYFLSIPLQPLLRARPNLRLQKTHAYIQDISSPVIEPIKYLRAALGTKFARNVRVADVPWDIGPACDLESRYQAAGRAGVKHSYIFVAGAS